MRIGLAGRVIASAMIVVCLLSATACRRESPPTPPGPAPTGTTTYTLDFEGQQRSYRLYVPVTIPADKPAPLVLMLHGGFGTAEHAQEHYGWDAAADKHGFVVAYPDGAGRAWNAGGGCCGASGREGVDDVGFISEVVADVGRRLNVDPQRVYATGMSNGAMMSYRLACDTTLFAAIAPVAGTLVGDCPTPAPVSVLHIHGLDDDRVRYDGEKGVGVAEVDGEPIASLVETWRDVDECDAPSTTADGPVTTVAAQCPHERDVVLVTIAGAGHQWPGSSTNAVQQALGADEPTTAIDATEVIAEFFLAHPRP